MRTSLQAFAHGNEVSHRDARQSGVKKPKKPMGQEERDVVAAAREASPISPKSDSGADIPEKPTRPRKRLKKMAPTEGGDHATHSVGLGNASGTHGADEQKEHVGEVRKRLKKRAGPESGTPSLGGPASASPNAARQRCFPLPLHSCKLAFQCILLHKFVTYFWARSLPH
jgi:hypothetical protein